MNFFGPIGLMVAFALVLNWLLRRVEGGYLNAGAAGSAAPARLSGWLIDRIDYRLILAGALIPDLIDKPLIFLVNPDFVNSSLRSVGHSTVGVLMLVIVMWSVLRRWRRVGVGSFGAALLAHLVLDQMWRMPEVLFWPVLGFVLPQQNIPFSHWYRIHFSQLPTTPPDFIGIAILIVLLGYLIWNRSVTRFLHTGRFS